MKKSIYKVRQCWSKAVLWAKTNLIYKVRRWWSKLITLAGVDLSRKALADVAFRVFVILGVTCFVLGLYQSNLPAISVGLAFFSVGNVFVGYRQRAESREQFRAVANFEFREKIAMMYACMDKQQQCIQNEQRAALELEKWVNKELKDEFHKVWREYCQFVQSKKDERV